MPNHGWNLDETNQISESHLWTDLGWKLPWVREATLTQPTIDADGNMVSGSASRIWNPTTNSTREGIYDLVWSGSGTFDGTSGWATNVTSTTGSSPKTFTISKPYPTSSLLLNFSGQITDLTIKHRDDAARTQILSATAEARLVCPNCIRAMDLWRTNKTPKMNDNGVVKEDIGFYHWYRKLPTIELLIDLCEELSCSLWLCIYHEQDDAWVINLADRIQKKNTDITIYVELSNEVWNFTEQNSYFGGYPKEVWVPAYVNRMREIYLLMEGFSTGGVNFFVAPS